ncbi:MAG: RNA 2',3'-cyclic phosphodiesterase, partial [Geminicoccaceae bacterium]|nr:RNA 2',3'-cyclic phosphodiesterase [Geminicoccaceae bacterium]
AVLRQTGAAVKWVEHHQFHLTLKFLGETPPPQVPAIVEAIRNCGAAAAPFQLALDGLGVFPDRGKPRVIWAGVGGETAVLSRLHREVQGKLASLGFPPEKRSFSPHLTLARVRSPRGVKDILEKGRSLVGERKIGSARILSADLMLSELSRSGPKYHVMARVPLPGPSQV